MQRSADPAYSTGGGPSDGITVELPFTGGQIARIAIIGAATTFTGILLLVAAAGIRRRRQAEVTA